MLRLSTNSELNTTTKREFYLTHNRIMKKQDDEIVRYPEFAARFIRAWQGMDSPAKYQKALAKKLYVSESIVSDWKNGIKLPSTDTAIALANYFQCNIEWLLIGNGAIYPGQVLNHDNNNRLKAL